MADEKTEDVGKIKINGKEYLVSDFSPEQMIIVQQINLCRTKLRNFELEMGQIRMAYNGFVITLEKSIEDKGTKKKSKIG